MATLLDKVSTLISANLHALVDQALKANSLAVIDQYIRQVEDNLESLADAAATVGAEIKSIRRKLEEHEKKSRDLDRAVDAFLTENNETAAASAQSQLNSTLQLVETYKGQSATQEVEYQKLLDARVKLEFSPGNHAPATHRTPVPSGACQEQGGCGQDHQKPG